MAIEGLSGSASACIGCFPRSSLTSALPEPCASRTSPTKRKPFRGNVLISRCCSPESPIAWRAMFMRVVSAASETMRLFQTHSDEVVFCDHPFPVADQTIEQVEHLGRDRDRFGPAMKFAPVGVECVVLEEVAHAGSPLGGFIL